MDSKKKFGLVMPQKSKTLKVTAKSIFDSESDEDLPQRKRPKIPQKKLDLKSKVKKELLEDPSIYEYDNIYDEMKTKQAESIAPKEKKNSRYIDILLKAADKKKKEYERRVEKKIQVERVKEGDKFKDKEAFVTSSYKKKLQEMEEEEERERRETMLNDMMDVTKQKDLSGFYRHFLKQTVGEEKIPTFGEKDVKKEVISDEEKEVITDEEKEVISDEKKYVNRISDGEKSSIDANKDKNHVDRDIDRDSDGIEIDSDSEHSEATTSNSHIKHSRNNSNESSNENCSDDKKNKKMPSRIKSKTSFKEKTIKHRKTSCSVSESDSAEENGARMESSPLSIGKHSTVDNLKKRNIHRLRHDSSDDSQDEKSQSLEDKSLDKNENSEKEAKKLNIYVKRTVEAVFAEAQARYFQRLASRNM